MPTVAQMVTEVRDNILDPVTVGGNPVTPRYSDTQILEKFNKAAYQIARRTFCVQKTLNIPTVAGTVDYALPDDYIQMRSFLYFETASQTPVRLAEIPLEETFANQFVSGPNGFARRGNLAIRLNGSTPNVLATGLVLDYYALPTRVTTTAATTDIPRRFRDALVHRTTALMLAGPDEEQQKAADANTLYEQAVTEAVDREKEASRTSPGFVRSTYNYYTGGFAPERREF